jgi:hypothetical protein
LLCNLPALRLEAGQLENLTKEFERASLYHRASMASRWTHDGASQATLFAGAALAGRIGANTANTAYDLAFQETVPGRDPRGTRGVLRRSWRLEAWTALLEAGVNLAPDLDVNGKPGIPQLAVMLADAFEPQTVDFATIGAVRINHGNAPHATWQAHLARQIRWRGKRMTWREAIRSEARAIQLALITGQQYRAHLWGSES